MNTVRKGDLFEEQAFKIIQSAIADKRLGLHSDCCRTFQKKPYYSSAREGNIIFDMSIEVWPPDADRCHLLYLIECKDYSGTVPVSDIEEFIAKMQQVAGYFVKGVFMTTGDVQQGGLNLLKNKNMMLIKVDAGNPSFMLYHISRNQQEHNIDRPVGDLNEHLEKLAEIRNLYEHGSDTIADWDAVIESLLRSELNASINWEQPGEKAEGLEFLSKKIISDLTVQLLDEFDPLMVRHGLPLGMERFISFLNETYGLRFVTTKMFTKKRAGLNGYYDQKKRTIHINPELEDTNLFAFVCAHEIAHFFLHKNLSISQFRYDNQENSKYDPISRKFLLEKEKHWIEWQANYFASCLLMPQRSLLWQLVKWQEKEGISKKGFIWLDEQPCNIRDYKVAITQMAYIFLVSRTILEFRMADLNLIKYKSRRGYNAYSLFGNMRRPKTLAEVLRHWERKHLEQVEAHDEEI
jgi:Zn-dependent peptidase ImmA (M78 family)